MKSLAFGIFPLPFPDENCYSLLCRYAVRRGRLNSNQVCQEMFGHTEPLSGYLFKPFRLKDLRRWFPDLSDQSMVKYGAKHSCYPFYTAFLNRADAEKIRDCRTGSAFAAGQAKRINRECGFSKSHKKNLWYCPSCVREDLTGHGETCWRRLPQMPGAVYCPVHRERFRESGVSFSETGYQLIPATYALIHRPDPEQGNGTIYSDQYIELSRDIAWLLGNGFSVSDRESLAESFLRITGGALEAHMLYRFTQNPFPGNRFEDYLADRILKDSGKELLDASVRRQLGSILSIRKVFGSIEKFCSE